MKNSFLNLYLKTLILSLILLGSTAYSTYKIWGNVDKASDVKNQLEDRYSYIPSENEGISFLLAKRPNEGSHGVYALIKTEPQSAKATITVLPWQLMGHSGTKHRTLDGFAESSGRDILNAVNSALKINVKKYILMSDESMSYCLDMLGGIKYDVPKNVEYENETDYVSVFAGSQQISGKMIIGLLENPENFGKNTDGLKNIGNLICAVLGGQDEARLKEVAEPLYKKLISNSDTNLSYEDYVMREDALFYMLYSESHKIDLITAEGNFDIIRDNFTPSEEFSKRVQSIFNNA